MSNPFFSIVITTHERARLVCRCIDSCLGQGFGDFEVVVVDDGSRDGTEAAVNDRYVDPRVRLVRHDVNRGINPARHTGVESSRGRWVVVVDSDDELVDGALGRIRSLIDTLPDDVRVLRGRQLHDDGTVSPTFVPSGPYGYEGRIRWAEAEGGQDAARVIGREVFADTPYVNCRRGAMETLFELDLAERETSVCVEDVLVRVHRDAANSWLRGTGKDVLPRLRLEAEDMLWMAETVLERHGDALRRDGPRQYATVLRIASTHAFLLGRRRLGMRYASRVLRRQPGDLICWATVLLGLLGPAATGSGAIAYRRLRAGRD